MVKDVYRRGTITIVLITVAAIVSGLSVPILMSSVAGTSTLDIPDPGVEITQTLFAPLVSDETDSAIIAGNWSGPGWSGIYHLDLPSPLIS